MGRIRSSRLWIDLVAAGLLALTLAAALAGCSGGGSGGGSGPAVPPPSGGGNATELKITITGVTINSPPVVNFTVTDQAGVGMASLAAADLRFNIAKLMPGSDGVPSTWQNYINRAVGGAVQGSQERSAAGYAFGTLVNQGNGGYTYTFATDIKSLRACPAPCTDADGKPLDISYQPGLTHRVTIQQANSAYPQASGVYDFVPSGGGVVTRRDIVATATCNTCHSQLTAHGTRVDTSLCVTCHNPGSWVAGTPEYHGGFQGDDPQDPLQQRRRRAAQRDRRHAVQDRQRRFLGRHLPAGCAQLHQVPRRHVRARRTPPRRATTGKCSRAWRPAAPATTMSISAPSPIRPSRIRRRRTPGGVMTDNSTCALCHAAGRYTDNKDIVVAHNFPARLKAAAAKFQYNIISVTPTTAGAKPVITFSVTDPTNANKPYDIKTDKAFTAGGEQHADRQARLEHGGIRQRRQRTELRPACQHQSAGQCRGRGRCRGGHLHRHLDRRHSRRRKRARCASLMEGHPAGDVTTAGTFTDRLAVKSVFKDFADHRQRGGAAGRGRHRQVQRVPRRAEPARQQPHRRAQVCAVCHNPNATDAARRPTSRRRPHRRRGRQAGRVDRLQDHDPRHPRGAEEQRRLPREGDRGLRLRRQRERLQQGRVPRAS